MDDGVCPGEIFCQGVSSRYGSHKGDPYPPTVTNSGAYQGLPEKNAFPWGWVVTSDRPTFAPQEAPAGPPAGKFRRVRVRGGDRCVWMRCRVLAEPRRSHARISVDAVNDRDGLKSTIAWGDDQSQGIGRSLILGQYDKPLRQKIDGIVLWMTTVTIGGHPSDRRRVVQPGTS